MARRRVSEGVTRGRIGRGGPRRERPRDTAPPRFAARGFLGAVAIGLLLALPSAGRGQSGCEEYDACALRIESGFFGARIVRGVEGERVAGIGLFPSTIPPFEAASDSVRNHYEAFRARKTTSGVLQIAAIAASAVALGLTIDDANANETGIAIATGVSFGFGIAAGAVGLSASNHLSRAVWWYNRGLRR